MPRKRPGDLLEAWAHLAPRPEQRPYLLYVGDGKLRAELEGRAREVGSEAVRFLGFKNQSELPAYYELCDLLRYANRV
jgi:glycosyltransferase involved in cell wall biosynthesis